MKILGKGNGHYPDFIVSIPWPEMAQLIGDRDRLVNLDSGQEVKVDDLFSDYYALRIRIKEVGEAAPGNLRALASLLETQIDPITKPATEETA